MNRQAVLRCIVVSLVVALVTPLFTIDVIAPIGPDGAPTSTVGLDPAKGLPEMRQLFGVEKYRYMLASDWIWISYLRASTTYFLIAFVASLGVSVWNARQRRDA
jgi:hypothetical protein